MRRIPDYNLGTAHGEIKITSDTKGADEAGKKLDDVKNKSGDTRQALDDTAKVSGVAGLAIAGGLAVAAKSAADFESKMSAVKAVSGASAAEMDQLSKKALQIGKDTSFSAAEGALAIEELVKAGISIPDVMNGAADATVALAAAGEVALPEAAALASNAMNQFNLTARDMPRVADLIAGAANASAIDVGEFGQSLTQVGAVANLAGASFDDTAAAIALMGNAGIKGSDAGTSLKTMLQNLQPSTKKQTALFKELGLTAEDGSNKFYDAEGNLKSFSDIAGILQGSLKGLTSAQKSAALETLFGTDAIRAAAIFSNQGAKGFDEMAASMNKVKAADVAKTRLDNVKGSLEALQGSLETAGIALGQILLPGIRKVVDGLTGLLNSFLSLPKGTQETIVKVAAVTAGLLLAVAAVIKIVAAIQRVIAIFTILKTALAAIRIAMAATWVAALGPIALIIAAIVAIVLIVKHLWENNEKFRTIVLAVWNAIKTAIAAVLNWFKGTLWPGIQAVWNGIVSGLQAMANFFKGIWDGIVAVVTAVWKFISNFIKANINAVRAIIEGVIGVLGKIWKAFWGTFGGVITAIFKLIVQIVKLYIKIVMVVIVATIKAIQQAWKAVWGVISAVFKAVWNVIKSVATAGVNFVKAVISRAWNAIKAVTSTVWNAIKSVVTRAINAVKGPVTSATNAVKSVLSRAWNAVKTVTSSVWNALKGVVGRALNGVFSTVSGVVGRIQGIFSGASRWLWDAGRNIIRGLLDGIESLINNVTSKLRQLTDLIPDVKGPKRKDLKLLRPSGEWIMQGLGDAIDRGIAPVLRQLAGITASIPSQATASIVGTPRTLAPVAAGLGAVGGTTYHIDRIEIPASDVQEFNNVIDFFGAINQKARAMTPSARSVSR